MREKSFSFSKINSHNRSTYQGGEKKVMKKALSGVLAASLALSSFASVAFAAEATPKTAEEMFKILAEKKIFDGYEDGSMGLDKTMTRAEVTKVLVKLLNLSENKAGASVYTDLAGAGWAEGYIGAATKAGIMDGVADGKFDPSGKFTTEQLAAVLVRALKLPLSTEAAEGVVADWAKAYVATAVKAGLIEKTADYTKPALRSVLVASSYVAAEKLVPTPVQAVEAKIVGAKKVEVKFAAAVADTTKADIAVKRGTSTAVVEKISWNDAKTVATIEFASKLIKGDYEVTVKGATEAALTAKFSAESEKVAKVEILSTTASLIDGDDSDAPANIADDAVQVGYKVSNQYGENITSITSIDANSTGGGVSLANGVATIDATGAAKFTLDQKISLTLIHTETATVATQTLTVAAQSKAAEVKVESLYNADNKTLKTTSTAGDFYLVVNAVDQYGQAITNAGRLSSEVLVTVSNPAVVSVNGLASNRATFETLNIKGTDKTVLKLSGGLTSGESVVTLIGESTGKSNAFTVKVVDGVKANTINFGEVAQTVASNETVNLPVTVTDLEGNEITDVSVLNTASTGVTITGATGNFIKVDGQVVFQFTSPTTTVDTTVTLTALTANTKTALKTITVKPAAVPTTIIGLDADVKTAVLVGNTLTTGLSGLKVEDQYGRLMSDAALKASLNADGTDTLGEYRIVATEATVAPAAPAVDTSAVNLNSGAFDVLDGRTANASISMAGNAKGSESITFTIEKFTDLAVDAYVAVPGSAKTISYRTVEDSEIVKYGVDGIGKVYSPVVVDATDDYNKAVAVTGETSDGRKVSIPAAKFIVLSKLSGLNVTGNVLTAIEGDVSYGTGVNEVAGKVEVVINATGESIEADVAVSKSAPTATTLEVRDSNGSAISTLTHNIGAAPGNTTFNFSDLVASSRTIYVKDQYGVVSDTVSPTGLVTFKDDASVAPAHTTATEQTRLTITGVTNASGAAPTITGNGTASAAIAGLANGDSFTVNVTVGSKTVSVKVNVNP
jgi:hypothetical protein